MKLLAHSLVSSTPVPYLHLGYLSASVTRITESGGNAQSPISPIIILAMILILLGSLTSIVFWRRSNKRVAGIVLASAGLLGVMLFTIMKPHHPPRAIDTTHWHYAYPNEATAQHMEHIFQVLYERHRDGMPLPDTLDALDFPEGVSQRFITEFEYRADSAVEVDPSINKVDGWRRPMVLRKGEEPGCRLLISAGPDGRFDTKDDIVRNWNQYEIEKWQKQYRKISGVIK